jgi:hypothetical protein
MEKPVFLCIMANRKWSYAERRTQKSISALAQKANLT